MFNNSTLNFTHPRVTYPYYGKIPWTVAFCLQMLMAMIGNFLIVWIVYKDNRLKTTTNYLIANMAVSDLIAALFAFPNQIVAVNFDNQWMIGGDIGNGLCKLTAFTIDTSISVSADSCVAIAIDRYFAVVHPFKRPFEGKIQHVIAVIWIIALIASSPKLYLSATIEFDNLVQCAETDWSSYVYYVYIVEVGLGSVFLAVFITITYTFTICNLYRRVVPALQNQGRRRDQQNKKVLKHVLTIAILLYICNGFYVIFMLLFLQGKLDHFSLTQLRYLVDASDFLFYTSLVYNFFVYLIFNDIYRENIKTLVNNWFCRSSRSYDTNRRQNIPVRGQMIEMNVPNLKTT